MSKVFVVLVPRENPNFEAVLSLGDANAYAMQRGIEIVPFYVLKQLPGFHVWSTFFGRFLDSDCTHLFLAADDCKFPPETIYRLVTHNKDLAGSQYRVSDGSEIRCAVHFPDLENFDKYRREKALRDNTLTGGLGAHTLTIKRKVIEKMIKDYPELHVLNWKTNEQEYALALPMIIDKRQYLDDSAFCYRAAKSGFKLWLDFGLEILHEIKAFGGFPPPDMVDVNLET